GATLQYYNATQAGNYSVEAFTYQGCSSGMSPAVLVDGIEENGDLSFGIYPNPNSGEFDLSFTTPGISDYRLDIFSVDGKTVYSEDLQQFSGTYSRHIDIRSAGSGSYVIRLTDGGKETIRRIIVF
ncbi:MAG TPA: T9SS type A sorting domain-containing protein, partial [Bacteroidia bacterium]|nr:T9SS type A sorting domain-containing protein [Bacteroidia bacterium]